jgi:hypothetical protein
MEWWTTTDLVVYSNPATSGVPHQLSRFLVPAVPPAVVPKTLSQPSSH